MLFHVLTVKLKVITRLLHVWRQKHDGSASRIQDEQVWQTTRNGFDLDSV